MRILSPYRDYYDHIAHIYGGGDPKVTYVRKKFQENEDSVADTFPITFAPANGISQIPDNREWYQRQYIAPSYAFKWLIIANKYYLLVSDYDKDEYKILNQTEHADLIERKLCRRTFWDNHDFGYYFGRDGGEYILRLSRVLKSPVFVIRNVTRYDHRKNTVELVIEKNIPILSDLGVASAIPPEQMYQNIAYYLANTINESPDMKPPVDVSDKDRIVQHGFDLKASFRHRK